MDTRHWLSNDTYSRERADRHPLRRSLHHLPGHVRPGAACGSRSVRARRRRRRSGRAAAAQLDRVPRGVDRDGAAGLARCPSTGTGVARRSPTCWSTGAKVPSCTPTCGRRSRRACPQDSWSWSCRWMVESRETTPRSCPVARWLGSIGSRATSRGRSRRRPRRRASSTPPAPPVCRRGSCAVLQL